MSFYPASFVEISIEVQYAFNTTSAEDGKDLYFLNRLTPECRFDFHIPFGTKTSYFLGSGLNYNWIIFETPDKKYDASNIGISFETGTEIKIKRIKLRPGIAYNIIKGDTKNLDGNIGPKELGFSGADIFFILLF